MKATDIRDMEPREIEQRIAEEERSLTTLRFQRAVASLENPIIFREKRRNIARMKTILRQKQSAP